MGARSFAPLLFTSIIRVWDFRFGFWGLGLGVWGLGTRDVSDCGAIVHVCICLQKQPVH